MQTQDRDRDIYVALSSLRELLDSLAAQGTQRDSRLGKLESTDATLTQQISQLLKSVDRLEDAIFLKGDSVRTRLALFEDQIRTISATHAKYKEEIHNRFVEVETACVLREETRSREAEQSAKNSVDLRSAQLRFRAAVITALITAVSGLIIGILGWLRR